MVHAKDCDTYNFLGQCKFIDDAAEVTQVLLEFLSYNMDRGEFCIIHLSNKLALSNSFKKLTMHNYMILVVLSGN